MATKVCKVCSLEQPIGNYHPNKTCSLGVVGTCRECSKIRLKRWNEENRERIQQVANSKNQSRKQQAVNAFGNKCADCNQSYPNCVYQFHHLDPTKKDVNPSHAMAGSETTMWKELDKCVMLCANCHILRHRGS